MTDNIRNGLTLGKRVWLAQFLLENDALPDGKRVRREDIPDKLNARFKGTEFSHSKLLHLYTYHGGKGAFIEKTLIAAGLKEAPKPKEPPKANAKAAASRVPPAPPQRVAARVKKAAAPSVPVHASQNATATKPLEPSAPAKQEAVPAPAAKPPRPAVLPVAAPSCKPVPLLAAEPVPKPVLVVSGDAVQAVREAAPVLVREPVPAPVEPLRVPASAAPPVPDGPAVMAAEPADAVHPAPSRSKEWEPVLRPLGRRDITPRMRGDIAVDMGRWSIDRQHNIRDFRSPMAYAAMRFNAERKRPDDPILTAPVIQDLIGERDDIMDFLLESESFMERYANPVGFARIVMEESPEFIDL